MSGKRSVSVNVDDLTFGELELFEDVTGLVMSDAMKQEVVRDKTGRPVPDPDDPKGRPLREMKMSARAMMGLVFLALRRDDESLTFDDVRKLKLSDIDFDIETNESDVDPTQSVEGSESDSTNTETSDVE